MISIQYQQHCILFILAKYVILYYIINMLCLVNAFQEEARGNQFN